MWASNLHLPLCLSKRGTRPEFVNRKRGNIKAVVGGREGEKNTDKTAGGVGGGGCHLTATSVPRQLTALSLVK